MYKVNVNFDMFSVLVLNRIVGYINGINIVVVDKGDFR